MTGKASRAQNPAKLPLGGMSGLLGLSLLAVLAGGKQVAPGLNYELLREEGPVAMHILRVDPRRLEVLPARALNDGVGREKVSSIARRKGAIAAVNGGYYSNSERYEGDPAGVLKIGASWYSTTNAPLGALGWTRDGRQALIGRMAAIWQVRFGEAAHAVSGMNRPRGDREVVLYSWAFHRSTLTDPGGMEAGLRDGRVVSLSRGGDAPIPPEGFVVSFGPAVAARVAHLKIGDSAVLSHRIATGPGSPSPDKWREMDFLVGGTPVLLENGGLSQLADSDFALQRHPRTAVCVRADGTWILLVADGRQPESSRGLTLPELAQALKALGCQQALNLDGGGSSVMYLNGKIVSAPSDFGVERAVSDALLIRPRTP